MASNEDASASPVSQGTSNLDCFLGCTIPTIQCHHMPKGSLRAAATYSRRGGAFDTESVPYYTLGDLWEAFDEWSAYGAGVPIHLPSGETVVQYYVPYLSALQIYGNSNFLSTHRRLGDDSDLSDGDSRDTSSEASSDSEGDKLMRADASFTRARQESVPKAWGGIASEDSDGGSLEEFCGRQGERSHLLFEFFDGSSPYGRPPLADKIGELAGDFPKLRLLRSIDLSSASWLSVAWYPIYRIPTGPTLRNLPTCFLTFHSLSMPFRDEGNDGGMRDSSEAREGSWNEMRTTTSEDGATAAKPVAEGDAERSNSQVGDTDQRPIAAPCMVDSERIALPAFGLASYKLSGAVWNMERKRVSSLARFADSWLKRLNVRHPDFDFFASHSAITRR